MELGYRICETLKYFLMIEIDEPGSCYKLGYWVSENDFAFFLGVQVSSTQNVQKTR